ncbi:MAG: oligosaccharide flippase family protein [Pseudomonadales bacterium]
MNPNRDAEPAGGSIDRQLRGSSVLLAGRLLSKFINFGVQVAIIRLLTKEDFGAFAYGLALVAAGEVLVKIGLGQGANRFVPYYFERGEHDRLLGTLLLVTVTILVLGGAGFAALWWIAGYGLAGFPSGTGSTVVLLLALLAPVQALDQICIQTLACFAKPWQIFLRKHVLAPLLRVLAVAVAFFAGGSSEVLAAVYLAGGVLGLAICVHLVVKELVENGVLREGVRIEIPWRPLIDYSLPLVSSDLVAIVLTGVTTVMLMAAGGETEVASMRAVAPAAALNLLVIQSFGILFLPSAARLFARNDLAGMTRHHWESVAWVSILSFPIFALTFCIAPRLVTVLFGEPYADSAIVLAVMSVGSFAAVVTAFSSEALQVVHLTRPLLQSNLLMIFVSVVLAALLIPTYGALGAAVAVTGARLLGAAVRQRALLSSGSIGSAPDAIRTIWWKLLAATVAASLLGWAWQPALIVELALLAVVCLALLRSCAKALDVGRTFPELLKVPLFRYVVAG